jgi:hypothetical protein
MRALFREFVAGKSALHDRHDRDMRVAWSTASLMRTKRIPELQSLLARRQVRQNVRQQRTALEAISAAYRIPIRKAKKKKR